ncbi:MAG: inositol-3-phosphate synthase, partial [Frankiales bacterium]|nr:inositol-3-phosphate synthase [Frankiales bacterium]
ALDRGEGGPVHPASTYFMKSPPQQVRDDIAGPALEAWINGEDAGEHAAALTDSATATVTVTEA